MGVRLSPWPGRTCSLGSGTDRWADDYTKVTSFYLKKKKKCSLKQKDSPLAKRRQSVQVQECGHTGLHQQGRAHKAEAPVERGLLSVSWS